MELARMTQEHPITPPPELLKHWEDQHFDEGENYDVMLTQAYQAGADQELEACIAWFDKCIPGYELVADRLRAVRRPKPPSLKEQALQALDLLKVDASTHGLGFDSSAIRRALESMPD
jgi:hypothetical protein